MGKKRKLSRVQNEPTKHKYQLRSISKQQKHLKMENFWYRFPHLGERIFGELNPQTLVTCRKLNRFLHKTIDRRIIWIKKIENYTKKFSQFAKEWITVMRKIPIDTLKVLATALRVLEIKPDQQWSPLHIAAKFHYSLFQGYICKVGHTQ